VASDYYETQVAEDYGVEDVEDDEYDNPDDSKQVRELKARRRCLRSLMRMSQRTSPPRHIQPTPCTGTPHSETRCAISTLLKILPRYTVLKVQLSKGNYLCTLSVQSENIDFSYGSNHDRDMDDLILRNGCVAQRSTSSTIDLSLLALMARVLLSNPK
jgi:hypothetical protein